VSWMRRHPLIVDSVFQHSSIRDKQFNTGLQVRICPFPLVLRHSVQWYLKTEKHPFGSQRWQRGLNVKGEEWKVRKIPRGQENERV